MPKERIIDERTGSLCDYKALTDECQTLAQAEGITWRRAAERIAENANSDKAESIVRQLNRKKPEDKPRSLSFLPGEAVLYEAIERQLGLIEKRARPRLFPSNDDGPFKKLASEAASIHELLKNRKKTLDALTTDESIRSAQSLLNGVEQESLSPQILIQMEQGRLASLLTRVKQLRHNIDSARPGPYLVGDY